MVAFFAQTLNAINLRVHGFIVVRGGSIIFKSLVQQHDFNFTYQLNSDNIGDLPSSGKESLLIKITILVMEIEDHCVIFFKTSLSFCVQFFIIHLSLEYIIVVGTNVLFENLYNNDIVGVVLSSTRA